MTHTTPKRAPDLLAALLRDTQDDGYRIAAERRAAEAAAGTADPSTPVRAGRDRVLLGMAGLLLGLVLIVAYLHNNRSAPTDARTRADLIARIKAEQKEADILNRQAESLANQVDTTRNGALGGASAGTSLAKAGAQAGTTPVQGPGVRVVLGNPTVSTSAASSGRAGSTPIGAISVLTDLDVRAVVNELWRDGAEAVAIDGIRLTPLSAIRFAGQAVLVDFQPVTSPYTIEAIGNPDGLITSFTDSAVASKYRTLASADGFTFTASTAATLKLAASVLSDPRYATKPGSTPTPSPTPTPSASPSAVPS